MKIPRWSKTPAQAEIEAFDGLHCSYSYRQAVQTGWSCPCCSRRPQELIRWSEIKGQHYRQNYGDQLGMGWTISLTRHHCHSIDRFGDSPRGRFEETLICGDCNTADAMAKRKLGLPKNFSFSPSELTQFVRCAPHSGKKEIDYDKARMLFHQALNL